MTTLREAAQMALDALEHGLPIIEDFGGKEQLQLQHKAISALYEALRAALAQPEQKAQFEFQNYGWWRDEQGKLQLGTLPQRECVGTAHDRREWQGLTDEEKLTIVRETDNPVDALAATEAKLKEKNGL